MAEIFRNTSIALGRPTDETLVPRTREADWWESGSDGFLINPLFEDAASAHG